MSETRTEFLSTSDLARAAGIHPNTVRLYEVWKLIPPAERAPSGYRRFTRLHRDLLCLARATLHGGWPGKAIRRSARRVLLTAAAGDLRLAKAQSLEHLALVREERAEAREAAKEVARWRRARTGRAGVPLRIREAAALLGSSQDMLRNWERNQLIQVPREPSSGYRSYGPDELRRLRVIRLLIRAGYSTMAVRRMMRHLDSGGRRSPHRVLDQPAVGEDAFTAADRWLTALADQERRALAMVAALEGLCRARRRR